MSFRDVFGKDMALDELGSQVALISKNNLFVNLPVDRKSGKKNRPLPNGRVTSVNKLYTFNILYQNFTFSLILFYHCKTIL